MLGDYLQDVDTYGKHWRGIVFRKSYNELEELMARAHSLFGATSARWAESKKTWTWPNGATFKMRHLEREQDADKYQGHQYTWIGLDEITLWANPSAFFKLKACLRYADADVPTKRIRLTGNPGGAGHQWVKERYVTPSVKGYVPIYDGATQSYRMYIPSKVYDNKILMRRDPGYILRLAEVGTPELVRMWLDGDWDVVAGAYFSEFRADKHVVEPCKLPANWTRFRAFDWGSARPHCNLWFAVSDGELKRFPRGALIVYREDYGASEPNVGLKLTVEQVAARIEAKEPQNERIDYSVADPSIFQEDGGESIYERFRKCGIMFRAADNKRLPGWNMLRARLIGEDDKPMLYIFSTCKNLIRTLPALQHDDRRPEDIDTEGEDHAADALRYGCMSRPYQRPRIEPPKPLRGIESATIDELWKLTETKKRKGYY